MGFALGLFFLALALSKVNWLDFVSSLAAIRPFWVVLSGAALLTAMILRGLRWHLVTGLPKSDFMNVLEATCIGYLGIIYPARAGEVLRVLRLKQITSIESGVAIGSAVVDRILEGLALCILLPFIAIEWEGSVEVRQGLVVLASFFILLACGLVVFVISGHRLVGYFHIFNKFGRSGERFLRWYKECLAGFQIFRSPFRIGFSLSIQVLVTLFDLLSCWFLFEAFGWDLPFVVSIVVLVYLIAALSLPSLPGYVGVYQVATLFALRPYAIESASAVAYGTVLQVITLLFFIAAGVWAHVRGGRCC